MIQNTVSHRQFEDQQQGSFLGKVSRDLASTWMETHNLYDRALVEIECGSVQLHYDAAVEWMRQQGPGSSGPPVFIEAGEKPRIRPM